MVKGVPAFDVAPSLDWQHQKVSLSVLGPVAQIQDMRFEPSEFMCWGNADLQDKRVGAGEVAEIIEVPRCTGQNGALLVCVFVCVRRGGKGGGWRGPRTRKESSIAMRACGKCAHL